jgi:hypothetical protein
MSRYAETRCDISDLPKGMCADCRMSTHGPAGRHVFPTPDGLDELVDTRQELGVSVPKSYGIITVQAEAKTPCNWDDCTRQIRVGDAISKSSEYASLGFVHAEHFED